MTRKLALAVVAAAWALGLGACFPRLRDGHFTCADGACPAGYRCDPVDRVCRFIARLPDAAIASDAGIVDDAGSLPDARAVRPFEPCESAGECGPGMRCFRGPVNEWLAFGYCTPTCSTPHTTTGCPPRPMSAELSLCGESMAENVCQLPCGGIDPNCPPGFLCAAWDRRPDGAGGFEDAGDCLPPGQPVDPVDPEVCTRDDDCWNGTCATLGGMRRCARPCGAPYACPDGVACVMSTDRGMVCMPPA